MIGHIVSHYRILQKMGGGGMGVVYKAEDLKLRRTVALKFLAPELTRDEDAKKRFLHEAQAASALDHPNICGIHEIDETPEGQLFIAMTCYDGESLKERLARRRVDVEEAFQISFAVAQGLGRAHASDIIHRDIKPGNVMITNDGFVKIIDFGLSKLIGRSRVTGSGATLGTVAYMSPEQARSEEVDARADIWALGAILYEMLTGRVPFRGEIDQAVVYSILNEEPAPIRSIRPDVPEACAAVVMKCLAKDPSARYQSAEDFCVAVFEAGKKLGWADSFVSGGVRAVSIVRPGKTRHRRRAALVVGVGLALLVAAFVWHPWKPGSVYSTEIRLGVVPFERLGDTPSQAFVSGLGQWVSEEFDRASRLHESMWVLPFARMLEDRPADLDGCAAAFGINRLVTGTVQRHERGYQLTLELIDANNARILKTEELPFTMDQVNTLPEDIARAVLTMLELPATPEHSARVAGPTTHSAAATRYCLEGIGYNQRYVSMASLDSARVVLSAALSADPVCVPALAALGYNQYLRFYKTRNPAELEGAEPILRTASKRDSLFTAATVYLAKVLGAAGAPEDGILVLRELLDRDPACIEAYQDLGNALQAVQRFDESEAVYRQLTVTVPDYFHGYWRLGWLYDSMNQPTRKLDVLTMALALAPGDFRTLNSLGKCYSEQGDWKKARQAWQQAFLLRPTCGSSSGVGMMLYYEGRFAESAKYYEYALGYCDTTDYSFFGNLACALYWTDDRHDEGIAVYRKAIARAEERLVQTPDDVITMARLADYHAMVGDSLRARELVERLAGVDDVEVYFRLACANARLGEKESAIDMIGKAVRAQYSVLEIKREPLFRDLVRDERLRDVLEVAGTGDGPR